jgi:hypothetical protein
MLPRAKRGDRAAVAGCSFMSHFPPRLRGAMRDGAPHAWQERAGSGVGPGNQRPPWPADKVERWRIERLIPYAKNARTHSDAQIAAIAASIKDDSGQVRS